mgnify:CR=1 FL=1
MARSIEASNAFFVASEFALVSSRRDRLESMAAQGKKEAQQVIHSIEHLSIYLAGAQFGITICSLILGKVAEPAIARYIEVPFMALGVPADLLHPIAFVIALAIISWLHILFGEMVPKNMAISAPLVTGRIAVPLQYVFSVIFRPVIAVLNGTANRALLAMGIEPQEEGTAGRSPEELTALVRHSAQEGTMAEQTADLVTRTLSFSERMAEDVMTPRTSMVSVNRDTTAAEIVEIARRTGYSRFPVVGDSRDDIVGMVHVKQAVAVPLANRADAYAAGLMSEVTEVPETMPLDPLLMELRLHGTQMALVVDEYGGTAGVVTLEDVVEELVGEVVDEHDRLRVSVRPARDGTWIVPGRMRPDEVSGAIGIEVPQDPDYETMAGYVMLTLGRIPEEGDAVRLPDARLVVERMHGRRIERLRLTPDYVTTRLGGAS